MVAVTQHSFAAGELSPGFWGRTDHPRFKYGVKSAVNMIVSQHGSLRKRPGMEHYYDLNAAARVFTIGTSSGPLLAALFRDKIVIIGSRANPQTLNIGENFYSESDLNKVQICQLGDTVTLVLPGHMPLEILNTNGIFTIRNRPGCYRDKYIANSAFTNTLKYNLLCWYQFEGDYKESLSDTTPTFYQAGDATFVSGGKPDSGKALKFEKESTPTSLPSSLTLGCLAFFPCDDEYEAVHGEAWTKGTDYATDTGKIGSGLVETRYNTNTGLRHAYNSKYPQFKGNELAQRTLAAWVKITVNNGNSPLLVVRWSGGNAYGFSVAVNRFGEYYADGNFDSTGRVHTFDTPIPENEWHHFAYTQNTYTYNNNTVVREFKYYFDGELVETKTSGGFAVTIENFDHMIGSHRGPSAQSSGVVDEVGIWQRALSGAEIKALYDAGNAGVTYPFDGYCPIDGGEVHLLNSLQRMFQFDDSSYDDKAEEEFSVISGSNSFVSGILNKAISEPKLKGTFSVTSPAVAGAASAFSWIKFTTNPGSWGGGLFGPAGSKSDGTLEVCNPAKSRAGITVGKYDADGNYALEGIVYRAAKYIPLDEWHLVGYTWDGHNLKIYMDGYKVGQCVSENWTETIDSSHYPFVGRTATQAGTQFPGLVDDTAYWTRALNESEILALWNDGQGLPYSQYSGAPKGTVFTEASSPDLSDLSNFAVSFWMKIDAGASATYITPFSIGPELCLYVSSGSSQIGLIFDGNDYDTYVPVNSAAWTHVVVQGYPTGGAFPWSPFRLELYVNGSLVWSTTCPRPTDQAYSRLALGCLNGAANTDAFVSGYSFMGEMDAIGVWKRRLNLSEVETLYNSGAGIFFSSTVPNKTLNDAVVTVKLKENIDYTLEALVPDPAYLWHKDSFYNAKLTHCPEDYDHPKLPWTWRFGFVYESPERGEFEAISEDYTLQLDAACYNDYHKHYIYVKVPTDTPSGMTLKALKVYRGRNGIFGLVERAESDDIIDYFQYYSSDNLESGGPSLVTVSGDNYWCVIDDVSIPDLSQQPPVPLEYNDKIFTESSSLPNSIGWFEQRAVFGGHASKPRTLYMSKTGQRYEFTKNGAYSPLDSDAMALDLATAEHERITAVTALGGRLIVLTDKNLWACGSTGQAMTPSDASAVCYNGIGSNGLRPLALRNSLLFVSQNGNEIYEIRADQNGSQWATRELGTFARHLLDGHKIVSWDYQSTPDPIVWLVREDGVLLSLTYNAETELCAWTRHATNAAVKSVACSGTDVWLSVVRNGHWQAEKMDMGSTSNYLDGMKVVSSLEIATSLGLHVWNRFTAARTLPLEGAEKLEILPVWATSDGQCLAGDAVESTVELLDAVSFEDVGLRPKTLKKISVDFISNSSLSLSESLKGRSSPERLSGTSERRIEFAHIIHGYGAEATGFIRSSQPCPLTILGVAREVDFGDTSMPGADRN